MIKIFAVNGFSKEPFNIKNNLYSKFVFRMVRWAINKKSGK